MDLPQLTFKPTVFVEDLNFKNEEGKTGRWSKRLIILKLIGI